MARKSCWRRIRPTAHSRCWRMWALFRPERATSICARSRRRSPRPRTPTWEIPTTFTARPPFARLDWEVVVSATLINTVGPAIQDRRRLALSAAALRDEVTAARGSTADLASRLNASLAPGGALVANAVATAQLTDGCVQTAK